jgi:DNA-binding NarL/FixJ family response regulator
MIRLLIVEGHPAIRRGLQMWLRLASDVTIVAEAADSLAALWQAVMTRPDVVLVHLHNADVDDNRLIDALRRAAPGSQIVVLSLYDDARTRKKFLGGGAAAFVSMHDVKEQLLQAIRRAANPPPPDARADRPGQAPPALKASGEL